MRAGLGALAGTGERANVGGGVSRSRVTVCGAIPPSLVALQVKLMPAVSVVSMLVAQPVELNGVSGALTVQLTVTLLWYQPLLPSVPVTVGVITGAGVSFRMWRSAVACRLAAPNEPLASS